MKYPHSNVVSFKKRMVAVIWLYAFAMIAPTMMGMYGTFGFDHKLGKCDFIPKDGRNPKVFFWSLGFGLPFFLIALSYAAICKMTKASAFLTNDW